MGEIVLISTLKIKISIPHGLVYHQSQRPQINHRNTYVGVPVNTEITNEEYWEQVSELYDTKGKVAYFIDTELPQNAALNCLQAVENYLYSFVLWRWYTIAGQIDEAQRTGVSNVMRQYLAPIQAGLVEDVSPPDNRNELLQ